MAAEAGRISEDALLGGKVILRQPVRGHRFGHDAVLLAAATPAQAGQHVVELGSGVGAAGAGYVDGLAFDSADDGFESSLDCGEAGLDLPAVEIGSVVGKCDFDTAHLKTAP